MHLIVHLLSHLSQAGWSLDHRGVYLAWMGDGVGGSRVGGGLQKRGDAGLGSRFWARFAWCPERLAPGLEVGSTWMSLGGGGVGGESPRLLSSRLTQTATPGPRRTWGGTSCSLGPCQAGRRLPGGTQGPQPLITEATLSGIRDPICQTPSQTSTRCRRHRLLCPHGAPGGRGHR